MNGAGDKLFAGPGFAEDQDSGVARSGELDLSERALDGGTLADDFLKIKFAADFFFEIKFFVRKFIFEGIDFLKGQSVFNRKGNMRRDAIYKVRIAIRISTKTTSGP